MKLVQNLKTGSTERRRMMASLVKMAVDLGITPLAEGIETEADHDACREVGFTCAQGFLYGYPTLPKRLVPGKTGVESGRQSKESPLEYGEVGS
jgi:EAL domain-containing protein (putative c-di-GMP-specific phosphodiesterase class I)